MIKNISLLVFSLLSFGGSSAVAGTFNLTIPTNSGEIISRQITSFDQRNLTAKDAYNYDPIGAKYKGIVPIQPGNNMFFVDTSEGLSLFMVNETSPNAISQIKYEITTEGRLLFRDDIPEVDNDPVTEILNPDGTTTFITTEGLRDLGCLDSICRTDGLVIGLNNPQATVSWKYYPDDPLFPMININQINFWSSNSNENFSIELGTGANQFNPSGGGSLTSIPEPLPSIFNLSIPTNSGTIITGQIKSFPQSLLTAKEAYNYDPVGAKYNGIVPTQLGTNMFFVDTSEGLSLFMVNETSPNGISQLRYQVTTEGRLLFRDDIKEVDNDPISEIVNLDGTTTFISTEGFRDIGCLNDICRTDGLVIGLTNPQTKINFQYDPLSFPFNNINQINFLSFDAADSFSAQLGEGLNQFNPLTGKIEAISSVLASIFNVEATEESITEQTPESSSIRVFLGLFFIMVAFKGYQFKGSISRKD